MVKRKYPKPKRYDSVKIPIYECCGLEFKGKAPYTAHLNSHHTVKTTVNIEPLNDAISAPVIKDETIEAQIIPE